MHVANEIADAVPVRRRAADAIKHQVEGAFQWTLAMQIRGDRLSGWRLLDTT
ncbi:hypothetical protein D3C84_1068480 [compost metagenome]